MENQEEKMPTICVETGLGVQTVAHEEVEREGGWDKWLKNNGFTEENGYESEPTHWAGPTLTRKEYEDLPELA